MLFDETLSHIREAYQPKANISMVQTLIRDGRLYGRDLEARKGKHPAETDSDLHLVAAVNCQKLHISR